VATQHSLPSRMLPLYLGRTSTGWIAPAFGWRTHSITSSADRAHLFMAPFLALGCSCHPQPIGPCLRRNKADGSSPAPPRRQFDHVTSFLKRWAAGRGACRLASPGRRSADELAASQRRGYLCPRSFVHLPGRAHGERNQSPSNTWWFENGCSSSGVARRLYL
jgi:hypothetical protein